MVELSGSAASSLSAFLLLATGLLGTPSLSMQVRREYEYDSRRTTTLRKGKLPRIRQSHNGTDRGDPGGAVDGPHTGNPPQPQYPRRTLHKGASSPP